MLRIPPRGQAPFFVVISFGHGPSRRTREPVARHAAGEMLAANVDFHERLFAQAFQAAVSKAARAGVGLPDKQKPRRMEVRGFARELCLPAGRSVWGHARGLGRGLLANQPDSQKEVPNKKPGRNGKAGLLSASRDG